MKITKHLKPRTGTDLSYLTQGNALKNIYWATFKRMPSELTWQIPNPKNTGAAMEILDHAGYTVEILDVTNLGATEAWEDRRRTILINKQLKHIMAMNVTPDRGLTFLFLYPVENEKYALSLHKIITAKVGTTHVAGRINLLGYQDSDFCLVALQLPKPQIDLALNYGASFLDIHNEIGSILNQNESGLILLHGITGSGKSTYIYHLIHEFKQKMIFIPNNVVSAMANPEFINFLMSYAKSAVLIIEDAEKVLLKRGGGGDQGVSTLLNLTDGILGKLLKCKVICTFNIERSQLDEALLRRGRLRKEHAFTSLSASDANKLLAHLGKERRTDTPLTLADIYNETGGREIIEQKVGFTT